MSTHPQLVSRRTLSVFRLSLLVAALTIWLIPTPALGAVIQHTTVPLEGLEFPENPCGEGLVHTGGALHVLVTMTVNDNRVSGAVHFQPQGAKLVGLESGDAYVGTGVTRESFSESLTNNQATATFVDNFRIIGKGQATNWLVHIVTHVAIRADGTISANVDLERIDCR